MRKKFVKIKKTRLGELIDALELGAAKVAETIGVSQAQMYRYLSDDSIPSKRALVALKKHYNVSFDWLLTGEGSMFAEDRSGQDQEPASSRSEKEHWLKEHPELEAALKAALVNKMEPITMPEDHQPQSKSGPPIELYKLDTSDDQKTIGVIEGKAVAGNPAQGEVSLGKPVSAGELLTDVVGAKNLSIIQASGDSMICAGVMDGDCILVAGDILPKDGHMIVTILDGSVTLKWLQFYGNHVELSPDNPDYARIVVPEQKLNSLGIIGVVVGLVRAIGLLERAPRSSTDLKYFKEADRFKKQREKENRL